MNRNDDGANRICAAGPATVRQRMALMADFIEYGHVVVNSLADAQYVAQEAVDMGDDWPVIHRRELGYWSVTARSLAGPSRKDAMKQRPGVGLMKILLWAGVGGLLWWATFYLLPLEAAIAVTGIMLLGGAVVLWIEIRAALPEENGWQDDR